MVDQHPDVALDVIVSVLFSEPKISQFQTEYQCQR